MRIGVDVDDVIFDWFGRAHEASEREAITNGRGRPSQWECWLDYGCSKADWLLAMEYATLDGTLYTGDPIPGAVESLHALRNAGHTLHIVTARGFFVHGDLIRKHTVDWLRDHSVPHNTLTFAKDKTLVRTDVFVDDSWKNVQDLVAAGVPTWMVDAPHNQGVEYAFRVQSVVEFATAILAMEEV